MTKRRKITITSKSQVPEDLFVGVLRNLEAKSLLRFRCVSKSWNSIISDPSFARLHLKRSRLLLYCYGKNLFRTADYEALKLGSTIESCAHRSFPFEMTYNLMIWGSCNGIICFRIGHNDVNLWNPTTGEVYNMPKPRDRKSFSWDARFGFGWDKSVNDYKVVRVLFSESRIRTEVEVLALKSNTWVKTVPGIDLRSHLRGNKKIIYCNGALHWLASSTYQSYHADSRSAGDLVVCFDLAEEKWQMLLLPLGLKHCRQTGSIGVLGDSLCFCSSSGSREDPQLDVWVMKEYSVESSWIKFTTITDIFIETYVPLWLTTDGGIIGIANDDLVLKSNPNSDVPTTRLIKKRRYYFEAAAYEETVVSLMALCNTPWQRSRGTRKEDD